MSSTTEADPAIGAAHREQAAVYGEAMSALLASGRPQVAALIAVQVVRSAALGVLVDCVGADVSDDNLVALLWSRLPEPRHVPALQQGANVLALHEDLSLFAYAVDADEAREVVCDALAFQIWALDQRNTATLSAAR